MNPRDFLREAEYPIALLTTYSFDPYFFERFVLPDVWAGGSNRVLVLVDQGALRSALDSHLGDLRHLGRRYFLQPVEWPGAFHPKIFLRAGDDGGLVWVGSNNLTRGGWGGNSELGSAWSLKGDGLAGSGWLPGLLTYLESVTTGLARELLSQTLSLPWLADIPGDGRPDILISRDEPIGVQLARSWAGRRFTSLKLLTGSTDSDAGFLRWASQTFGLEEIDICLTPESASFEVEALETLGPAVRIVPAREQKLMHAKFYWFDGPDGPAVSWGSANCSRSAWLIPGRNLEAMVIEDAPEPDQYSDILRLFEEEGSAPSDVLTARRFQTGRGAPEDPPLRIVAASAEATGTIHLRVEPAIPTGAVVNLEIGGARLPLEGANHEWAGDLGNAGEDANATMVCVVAELPGSGALRSDVRWIDRLSELRDVLTGTDFRRIMGGMARFDSRAADKRLPEELGRIGMAILTDRSSYPDIPIPTGPKEEEEGKKPMPPPLDPEALLVSLGDSDRDSFVRPRGTVVGYGIGGVFRALFARMDDQHVGADVIEEPDEEPEQDPGVRPEPQGPEGPPVDVDAKASERLQRHMERFLNSYESAEFASTCTATQLAQATAYPIAVAAMGERRGWCTVAQRGGWVSRTARAFLKDDRYHERDALVASVRRRYAAEQQGEVFERAIGDGQLWLVLLAAWNMLPGSTTEERLQRMTLFRDFVSRRELLGTAEEGRIADLFSAYFAGDLIEAARSRAMRLGRTLRDLERSLGEAHERLLRAQAAVKLEYKEGELVWSPRGGWGITKADQRDGKVSVYVAKGDDVRPFRAAGWFVNVSRLGETPGVPVKLVVGVGAFLEIFEEVDGRNAGTAMATCDLG